MHCISDEIAQCSSAVTKPSWRIVLAILRDRWSTQVPMRRIHQPPGKAFFKKKINIRHTYKKLRNMPMKCDQFITDRRFQECYSLKTLKVKWDGMIHDL